MRSWLIAALLMLTSCVDPNVYLGVQEVGRDNREQPLRYEFKPISKNCDVSLFLRYDLDIDLKVLPIELRVEFEDGKYYSEKVEIKLQQNNEWLGKQRGGDADLEVRWRDNVDFSRAGLGRGVVRVSVRVASDVKDWDGIKYFGIRVSNARYVLRD